MPTAVAAAGHPPAAAPPTAAMPGRTSARTARRPAAHWRSPPGRAAPGPARCRSCRAAVDLGIHPADEERSHRGNAGQVAPGGGRLLQAGQVGVDHLPISLQREDQRDVDADPLGQGGGDRGQPGQRGRDLDKQVRPVHQPPQRPGLGDGLGGVIGDPRIDLEGDPPVQPAAGVVSLAQDVTGPADVVAGDRPGRFPEVDAAHRQVGHLAVVGLAVRQGVREDGRIGGHADHVEVSDQGREIPGGQPLPADVVEPDRHASGGKLSQSVVGLGHDISLIEFSCLPLSSLAPSSWRPSFDPIPVRRS